MTLIDQLKKNVSEWMTKPEVAPETEAPKAEEMQAEKAEEETPVAMAAEDAPADAPADAPDLAKMIADLGALVVAMSDKLDALMADAGNSAQAMSRIDELKKEVEDTKSDITKLAAQPVGEVIGKKKEKVAMKAVKPSVAALSNRIFNNN